MYFIASSFVGMVAHETNGGGKTDSSAQKSAKIDGRGDRGTAAALRAFIQVAGDMVRVAVDQRRRLS